MANSQSKQWKAKPQSGSSKQIQIPKVLAYPGFIPLESAPSIKSVFCYVIKHYGDDGLSALVYRHKEDDQVALLFGDWKGNNLDIQTNNPTPLTDAANKFVAEDFSKFLNLMYSVGIPQAQFFFGLQDGELVLADIQLSLNKFASPGMIRDIFGKIYRTQEVRKLEVIDDRALEYLEKGTGSYDGDIILKPSRFRMHHEQEQNSYQPLYVEVRR